MKTKKKYVIEKAGKQSGLYAVYPTLYSDAGTQDKIVLDHLKAFGSLTAERAVRLYSIFRLAAIIHKLQRDGHAIKSELQYNPENKSNHYSKYIL